MVERPWELWHHEEGESFDILGPRLSVITAVHKTTCSNTYWELTLCQALVLRTLYTIIQRSCFIPFYPWGNRLNNTYNFPKVTDNKDSIACILTPFSCFKGYPSFRNGRLRCSLGPGDKASVWCRLSVKLPERSYLWRRDNLAKVLF